MKTKLLPLIALSFFIFLQGCKTTEIAKETWRQIPERTQLYAIERMAFTAGESAKRKEVQRTIDAIRAIKEADTFAFEELKKEYDKIKLDLHLEDKEAWTVFEDLAVFPIRDALKIDAKQKLTLRDKRLIRALDRVIEGLERSLIDKI